MIRQISRLNEEIARWAFEIQISKANDWYIAFTNPTAGPWKTIKAKNSNKIEGEIYRFQLEEDRPDIIMYNDRLETIVIFEAKDTIEKLFESSQMEKSSEVFINLSNIMKAIENPFWGNRKSYKVILGLLWGAEGIKTDKSTIEKLFNDYHEKIINNKKVYSGIVIGIESLRVSEYINCISHYKSFDETDPNLLNELIKSLYS